MCTEMSAVAHGDRGKSVGFCRRGSISCPNTAEAKDCPNPAKNSVACVKYFAVAHGNHSDCLLLSAFSYSGIVGAEWHVRTSSASISMYVTTTSIQSVPANSSPVKKAVL